ncbi:hypothetical protein K469DRAFT_719716 [Zopfia rhizophila CBS 207.26]|uniref:Uncharacterized protein n=1 Tax=Zopfia rhizophila CBS 207.26 TaxID=1314779 RepID=A0A6A6DGP4_9PEZI|nr:hypothetical protein K469DRAFT_719716 [Zopfia rhizophila CBS 207.26]
MSQRQLPAVKAAVPWKSFHTSSTIPIDVAVRQTNRHLSSATSYGSLSSRPTIPLYARKLGHCYAYSLILHTLSSLVKSTIHISAISFQEAKSLVKVAQMPISIGLCWRQSASPATVLPSLSPIALPRGTMTVRFDTTQSHLHHYTLAPT